MFSAASESLLWSYGQTVGLLFLALCLSWLTRKFFYSGIFSSKRIYTECASEDCVRCNLYHVTLERARRKLTTYNPPERSGKQLEPFLQNVRAALEDSDFTRTQTAAQKPTSFHLRCLTASPWWNTDVIQDDTAVLKDNEAELMREIMHVSHDMLSNNNIDGWKVNNTSNGTRCVLHYINQGNVDEFNLQRCPAVARCLTRMPSIMRGCVFGNVCVSVLFPNTTVDGHYGPTNIRLRAHLGVNIPSTASRLQLEVDGKARPWTRGDVILFDDSYLHGAQYLSDDTCAVPRVVFMFDVWHPELRRSERRILQELFSSL